MFNYLKILILFPGIIFLSCKTHNREMDKQKLENFTAFAKLYGYVRYFYPGDEAAETNWDKFTMYGMQKVENASNSEELVSVLNEVFSPIAPAVEIKNTPAPLTYDIKKYYADDVLFPRVTSWQHLGVYLSGNNGYRSVLINKPDTNSEESFGTITRYLDARKYAGRKIKIKAAVKTELGDKNSQGQLWLRVDKKNRQQGFFDNMNDRPIKSNEWKEYEIKGTVDDDAMSIWFGCFLNGAGKLWVDEFRIYEGIRNSWKEIPLNDPGFEKEEVGKSPVNWDTNKSSYTYTIVDDEHFKGSKCLLIAGDKDKIAEGKLFEKANKIGDYFSKKLAGGIYCAVPLTLYMNEKNTYPKPDSSKLSNLLNALKMESSSDMTADNLYVRLSNIAVVWNIFRHFYPYFDVVKVDWEKVLPEYLEMAYEDKDEEDFYVTLRKLVAELKDGHGRVNWPKDKDYYYPPVIIDYIENKYVVSRMRAGQISGVEIGDEIVEVDGIKVDERVKELKSMISGAAEQWIMNRVINEELLRGAENLQLTLKLKKQNDEITEVQIKRNYSFPWLIESGYYPENRPDRITELKPGIMYINLSLANIDEINKVMDKLVNAKGVIFDMRGYPNSNHEIITHLLNCKDTSGKWMQIPQVIYPDGENLAGYQYEGWFMEPMEPHINAKVVFLTNGRAISYAESFMGFIEFYKLGVILGEPTAGTNGNVNSIQLQSGFRITWTGMKVVKHDGSQHHGVGIQPTIPFHRTLKGVMENRDEFVEKAVEVIEKGNK
jgi:C-terminal processing protease CtpA/Prc